ncbi:MAG: hypothetical protein AAF679_14270, partial [Pseudomonadota bacterium]
MVAEASRKAVENMLVHCAGAQPDQHVLMVCERPEHGYYNGEVAPLVTQEAQALGFQVTRYDIGFDPNPSGLPN